MDIGMTRNDYEQFAKYAPARLRDSHYFLQTAYSDHNYGFSYMKLLDRYTYIEEKNNANNARKGVFIDIFPFDRIPDDPASRRNQITRFKLLDSRIILKAGYGLIETPLRRLKPDLDPDQIESITDLKQERDQVMRQYNAEPFLNLKNLASQYAYDKEILTVAESTALTRCPLSRCR